MINLAWTQGFAHDLSSRGNPAHFMTTVSWSEQAVGSTVYWDTLCACSLGHTNLSNSEVDPLLAKVCTPLFRSVPPTLKRNSSRWDLLEDLHVLASVLRLSLWPPEVL